jgi:antitoxin Xre/MbcA/ParS-like protein
MTSKPPSGARSGKALDSAGILRLAVQAETIPAGDPRRIAASVAMFERLSEHWSLRANERETLLGGISKSTWSEWRQRAASARIKSDTRERIANLFTIDLNAHALFAPEFADRWIREPNAAFGGESPMSTMLRGKVEDVITVRRYLERVRTSSLSDRERSGDASAPETLAVSYLPGHAAESDDDAALPSLRHAAAIYERLSLKQPARYRQALASALSALATCLDERNDAEALPVLRRAVEIRRQVTFEEPAYSGELLRAVCQLIDLLMKLGDRSAALAMFAEYRDLLARELFKDREPYTIRENAPEKAREKA